MELATASPFLRSFKRVFYPIRLLSMEGVTTSSTTNSEGNGISNIEFWGLLSPDHASKTSKRFELKSNCVARLDIVQNMYRRRYCVPLYASPP